MTELLQLAPEDISSSALEYRATFADPIFEAWGRRAELQSSLFQALKPLVGLSDLAVYDENTGNARLELSIPSQRLTLTVSLGYLGAVVTKPDWGQEQTLLEIASKAKNALESIAKANVSAQWLSLALHLLPRGQELRNILSKLANPGLAGPLGGEAIAWGFAAYTQNAYRIIDVSRVVPGAAYVGLYRSFGGLESPQSATEWLRREERETLEILGLKL